MCDYTQPTQLADRSLQNCEWVTLLRSERLQTSSSKQGETGFVFHFISIRSSERAKKAGKWIRPGRRGEEEDWE